MPSTVASFSMVSREGLPVPDSMRWMVLMVTPLISARSLCLRCRNSRLYLIALPISIVFIGNIFLISQKYIFLSGFLYKIGNIFLIWLEIGVGAGNQAIYR